MQQQAQAHISYRVNIIIEITWGSLVENYFMLQRISFPIAPHSVHLCLHCLCT